MDNNINDVNPNAKYIAELSIVELNAMIDARIEQNRNKTLKTDFLFWFVMVVIAFALGIGIYGFMRAATGGC